MTQKDLKHTSDSVTVPARKTFRNRMQMLHFVASDDYDNETVYSADGGQTQFIDNMLFRNGVQVGQVDRVSERVYVNRSQRRATSLWRYQEDLIDAFKHYQTVGVTAFTYAEAVAIFKGTIYKVFKKNTSYRDRKDFVEAFETIRIYGTCEWHEEYQKLYEDCLKSCLAVEKKQEQERQEYEKKRKKQAEEDWKTAKQYVPKFFKGRTWNDKLKHYCSRGGNSLLISAELWKKLDKLQRESEFSNQYWSVNSPDWDVIDGVWQRKGDVPEVPRFYLGRGVLQKLKGTPEYADFLYLDGEFIKTSRGVMLDDSSKLVRNLLKRFINCDDKARQKFIGLHVGSFVIREWNLEQRYLQIGCHRFYEQTLKEFAEFIKKGK